MSLTEIVHAILGILVALPILIILYLIAILVVTGFIQDYREWKRARLEQRKEQRQREARRIKR